MTANYQLSLPFALLSASPSLAALHATRARILHPTKSAFLDSTHCINCGFYFTHADIQRPTWKSSSQRVMKRTCRACGFRHEIPVDSGNAGLFPSTRQLQLSLHPLSEKTHPKPEASSLPLSSSSVGSHRIARPSPTLPPVSKSRAKKKSGLQDMLSRNREKEAKQREAKNEELGGLAAFLSGL